VDLERVCRFDLRGELGESFCGGAAVAVKVGAGAGAL
jgi:hypothetical protein